MIMFHRCILPRDVWGRFEALAFEGWNKEEWRRDKELLFPFLLTVSLVQSTWRALSAEQLELFDPIVRENSCHIRASALFRFFRLPVVVQRMESLARGAQGIEKRLRGCLKSPKAFLRENGGLHFSEVALEVDSVGASALLFLVQAHLLTIGKVFSINTEGKEVSQLPPSRVRGHLKLPREMSEEQIRRMILASQSSLSLLTTQFIEREASELFADVAALPRRMLIERKFVDVSARTGHPEPLMSSCSLFNFQVVLKRLLQSRILVLVKENNEGTEAVFFRKTEEGRDCVPITLDTVDRSEPVFVFEGFLPGGRAGLLAQIEAVGGLSEAILINVSHLPQFGVEGMDDLVRDEGAEEEISRRRRQARELGCHLVLAAGQERRFFTISHTFAALAKAFI